MLKSQASQVFLSRLLKPRSAVFIGGSVVEEAIEYTRANNFLGEIYVVNPFKRHLAGLPCYPTLTHLPEVPDIAYVGVPKEAVVETIQTLSNMGCGGAVCNTSGFSEIEGEGRERQENFKAAAGNMPALGPNCPGIANYVDRCVFMQGYFGDHSDVDKGVAVISNGGAYLSDMGTANRSVPLAYSFGMGNQAVVSITDIFDAILDDDRVLAVNLYFESVPDAPKLSKVALKAVRKGIPVVVVKGGWSPAGQRAAQTHTASLAGDERIASALFERLGFIQCNSPDEALETLKMLIFTRSPAGNRLAFSTSSGTYAVLGSDMAERAGLQLPALTRTLKKSLSTHLPDYILPSNPLDISNGQYFSMEQQRDIYKIFFEDDFDIAVLVMCFPPEGGWNPSTWNQMAKAFALEAGRKKLPCAFVNTLAESIPEASRKQMIDNGMVPLQGLQHGFQALANSVKFSNSQLRLATTNDVDILVPDASDFDALKSLDEYAGKELLKKIGIAVPKSVLIETLDGTDLQNQLEGLSFPLVVKAVSNELLHKTELDALHLNLINRVEVKKAIEKIKSTTQTTPLYGLLIEEMVDDAITELMISITHNKMVGQVLTIAAGGLLIELLQDAQNLILPVSGTQIEQTLCHLALFPILNGYRGKPKASIGEIVNVIKRLSDYAHQQSGWLHTLEINPLIVRPQPHPPVAVDIILQTADDGELS